MVELRILEIKLEFLRFLMVELRFLIVELRYLGVDWDCLKISYDFKENLKIDFHQGDYNYDYNCDFIIIITSWETYYDFN